ncbi:hypothetical protein BDZ85DRAFT_265320 [Elsinoe ampelina]|uniref:DUF7726 domain-containing protein n=1 Tax=Elsinoe ampelina TaxID=302913 RepID=A0A6A6G6Z3_9PEZI|nr:hypothetical protein BDZ85DRAFT_265320 [Elsinoe ampelina]
MGRAILRKKVQYKASTDKPATPLAPRDSNIPPARRDSAVESPNSSKKRSIEQVDLTNENNDNPKPAKQKKSTTTSSTKGGKKNEKKNDFDVSGIHLDGEDDDSCPIFDTCQDIRNKINAELRKGTTKAELVRQISAQFNTREKITASQLQRFMDNKGPLGGAESGAFYGGYVFFEKLRLKQGKPESKKRLEVKQAHPNGMPRKDSANTFVTLPAGEKAYIDNLGRMSTSDHGRI